MKKVLLHILFWVIVTNYFAWGFGFGDYKTSFINAAFYLPGFLFVAYSLNYFLIPRYLIKKKYGLFFTGFLMVLFLCMLYAWQTQLAIFSTSTTFKKMSMTTGKFLLPFVHVGAIAISIKLLKYWYLQKQQTVEAQQQKMLAELRLLKSQVHPHFLFNTLNNLYSLTLDQSPKAPEIVLKLSNLLRFMIYESNVPLIPLEKEISLLQEYISLEQLRYGDRLDVSVSVNGDTTNKQIEPLLLLPLVENAFKHGTSNQVYQCWISFDLHITDEAINFKLVNSKDTEQKPLTGKPGGMGLQNVKKRLDLLYEDTYVFETSTHEDVFIVHLILPVVKILVDDAKKSKVINSLNQKYDMEVLAGG